LSKGRLARLTRAYPVLQGYATLPWLLVFLIPLLVDTGVVRGGWSWLLVFGCLLAADILSRRIRRWYEGRFGLVRPVGGKGWGPFLSFIGLSLLGFVLIPGLLVRFMGVSTAVFDGDVLSWPFVVLGSVLLGSGFMYRPYLPFNVIAGALLLSLALVPLGDLLGLAGGVHPFNSAARLPVLALGLICHAFTAHATLVRELHQIQLELGDPGAVGNGDTDNESICA
jgi:hypothetical protein